MNPTREQIDAKLAEVKAQKAILENPSFMQQVGQFGRDVQNTGVVRAGTSFVDALGNSAIKIGNTLVSPFTEQRVPLQNTQPGEGFSKSLGRSAGDAFAALMAGDALKAGATSALGSMGKASSGASIPFTKNMSAADVSKYLMSDKASAQMIGRLGEAGALSALFSNGNPLSAATSSVGIQAGFEAIPVLGKAAGKTLDFVPGTEYMNDMLKRIQSQMTSSKSEASKLFESAKSAAGSSKIDPSMDFLESMDTALPHLDKKSKEIFNMFSKDQSYDNAFKLQSTLASRSRKIKGNDFPSLKAREDIDSFRKTLLEDMGTSLSGTPGAKKDLDKAMFKYATEYAPYLGNKTFSNIEKGLIGPSGPKAKQGIMGQMDMKQMQDFLKKQLGAENNMGSFKFPETHPLNKELKDLNKRYSQSQAATVMNPLAGLMVGTKHITGIDPFALLQSPEFLATMAALEESIKKGGPAATAGITQRSQ